MRAFHLAASALLLLPFATGCVEELPPPAPPAREVPQLDMPDGPPAAGTGRVIVDTNGEKAKVSEVTGTATAYTGRYVATIVGVRPLCTTPCVVDLPYGTHPLVLESTTDETHQSTAELDVGPKPKVFRHALGERTSGGPARTIGLSLLGLGFITAMTGGLLWGVGAMTESSSGKPSGLVGTGQVITGVGAGAVLLSLPLLFLARPTERPGSTTEWTVPPGSPNAPVAPTPSPPGGNVRL